MKKSLRIYDPVLFTLALVATCLGLLFIFDAGYARALQDHKGGLLPPEFQSQLIFLVFAGLACWWASSVSAASWRKWSKLAWVANLVLLVLVLVIGHQLNGAKRWLGIGTYLIQPAEFAKLAAIVYLAGYFAERKAWPKKIKYPKTWVSRVDNIWIPKLIRCLPAIWVFAAVILIELEPDMGTGAVIAATGFAMFFPARVTRKSILLAVLFALVAGTVAVVKEPYRLERFTNHAGRWSEKNIDDLEYQSDQSELAQASGGIPGVGFANGRAKYVMPATTTDFIWATIGEETGLWGSFIILGVLGAIVFRLLYLAKSAKTRFDMLLLYGVGSWIGIQTCVNVMMANAFLPAIGIPLPFISSGGSSLVALWMAIGACQATLAPVPDKDEIARRQSAQALKRTTSAHAAQRRMPPSTLNHLKVTGKQAVRPRK